jgi:hypothetical protein
VGPEGPRPFKKSHLLAGDSQYKGVVPGFDAFEWSVMKKRCMSMVVEQVLAYEMKHEVMQTIA